MCPDRQILSVYYDRELPSPWKEHLEAHLVICPECRAALAKIEGISAVMREEPVYKPGFSPEEVRDRVWDVAAGQVCSGGAPGSALREFPPRRKVWNRSVVIPLPAAAAAVALFVLAFTLALVNRPSSPDRIPDTVVSAGLDLDAPGIVPVSTMNDVLQYIGQDNSGTDFMIIRLPETKHFMRSGEPAIIRAADYSRGTGNK
ncbi:MAG: hypothetical protein LBH70_03605 [Spirochaetaceae bacterium]|jgi:hypothetical protein|nr:hypothetical protein [Spirochaetaceae bacterium]